MKGTEFEHDSTIVFLMYVYIVDFATLFIVRYASPLFLECNSYSGTYRLLNIKFILFNSSQGELLSDIQYKDTGTNQTLKWQK